MRKWVLSVVVLILSLSLSNCPVSPSGTDERVMLVDVNVGQTEQGGSVITAHTENGYTVVQTCSLDPPLAVPYACQTKLSVRPMFGCTFMPPQNGTIKGSAVNPKVWVNGQLRTYAVVLYGKSAAWSFINFVQINEADKSWVCPITNPTGHYQSLIVARLIPSDANPPVFGEAAGRQELPEIAGMAMEIGIARQSTDMIVPLINYDYVDQKGDPEGVVIGSLANVDFWHTITVTLARFQHVWYYKPDLNTVVPVCLGSDLTSKWLWGEESFTTDFTVYPNDCQAEQLITYAMVFAYDLLLPSCWPEPCLEPPDLYSAFGWVRIVQGKDYDKVFSPEEPDPPPVLTAKIRHTHLPTFVGTDLYVEGQVTDFNINLADYRIVTFIQGPDTIWYPKSDVRFRAVIDPVTGCWRQLVYTHPNDARALMVKSILVHKDLPDEQIPACWPQLCQTEPQVTSIAAPALDEL
jgi:hypothetical protein